jgi:hypothetical protein
MKGGAPGFSSLPSGLPHGTSPQYWRVFRQGLKEAKKRLRKKSCGNFYGGQGPSTLDATQYRFLDLGSTGIGASTNPGFSVFLNSNANGPYMSPPSNFLGVGGSKQIRGLIFLHELGHELANITLFVPDVGSDVNQLQSSLVVAHCF